MTKPTKYKSSTKKETTCPFFLEGKPRALKTNKAITNQSIWFREKEIPNKEKLVKEPNGLD